MYTQWFRIRIKVWSCGLTPLHCGQDTVIHCIVARPHDHNRVVGTQRNGGGHPSVIGPVLRYMAQLTVEPSHLDCLGVETM